MNRAKIEWGYSAVFLVLSITAFASAVQDDDHFLDVAGPFWLAASVCWALMARGRLKKRAGREEIATRPTTG